MPYLVFKVHSYGIRYYGHRTSGTYDFKAMLDLFGPETSLIGRILFWTPELLMTSAKAQDRLDHNGRPIGHMSITEIGGVVDMLRSEKPIYVHWNDIREQVGLLTGGEPVGEEEF